MEEINQATDQLINSIPEMVSNSFINAIKQLAPIFAPWVALVIVVWLIRIIYKQWKKRKK